MIRHIFQLLLFAFIIAGCNSEVLVSEEFALENAQWLNGDKKSLTITAADTSTVYQMDVNVRHTTDYGFQNLYVRTLTTFPSGKEVTSITSLELINPDGSWSGKCSGDHCEVDLTLQSRFTFPEVGNYTWSIEPYMRMDTVAGIESVEVICRKHTN